MTIAVGDPIPAATLATMGPDGPDQIETASYFAGRRIALFAVPGAFTPICSARHMPGFIDQAEAIKAKGIDEIAALAVNDIFVMAAWGKQSGAEGKVTLLADGNGTFAKALGLDYDASQFGMGRRAQRFSMIVDDGKVEQLNVEAPGEFRVSSADYLLGRL